MLSNNPSRGQSVDANAWKALLAFFNNHHDKLLCTASGQGEPNVSLMGSPRLSQDKTIDFEISDRVSVTLNNIRENRSVVFIAYVPGQRARDYRGARVYARVDEIATSGERFESTYQKILNKYGADKASELQATVRCTITNVRPLVDRGQQWNEPPLGDD